MVIYSNFIVESLHWKVPNYIVRIVLPDWKEPHPAWGEGQVVKGWLWFVSCDKNIEPTDVLIHSSFAVRCGVWRQGQRGHCLPQGGCQGLPRQARPDPRQGRCRAPKAKGYPAAKQEIDTTHPGCQNQTKKDELYADTNSLRCCCCCIPKTQKEYAVILFLLNRVLKTIFLPRS